MIKRLDDFLKEAGTLPQENEIDSSKESIINFIIQNFYRFINNPNMKDDRGLLMLVAALSAVSASDGSPQALQAAKRLAQNALSRTSKMKKEI